MVDKIGTLRRDTFGCMPKQSAQSIVHIRQIETAVTALLYKEIQGDIMERFEKMYFDYVHDHIALHPYLLDDFCGYNLYYAYNFMGEWRHAHTFTELLQLIVDDVESQLHLHSVTEEDCRKMFNFDEYLEYYSNQELITIGYFIKQCVSDMFKLKELSVKNFSAKEFS